MNVGRDTQRRPKPAGPLSRRLSMHKQVAFACLGEMASTPVASMFTALVIAVALVFPGLLYLISANITASLGEVNTNSQLTVYLEVGLTEERIQQVSERLHSMNELESIVMISADEGLREFSAHSGLADLLLALPENPLPASFLVTPDTGALSQIEALTLRLEELEGVDSVQFDQLWLQRLQALSDLMDTLGSVLLLLVLFGVFAIIGNTVKLSIAHRQQEIRVIKLVGGTDAFVARPFLYTGTLLGLAGALLACLILGLLGLLMAGSVNALGQLYGSEFRFSGLRPFLSILLLAMGAGTGWIAALFSSYRNIAAIDP